MKPIFLILFIIFSTVTFSQVEESSFLIIGHRGSPHLRPENTISSFNEAMSQGANALEIDIAVTKDNQVVIIHDPNPEDIQALARQSGLEAATRGMKYIPTLPSRGSDERKNVKDLTLEEIKKNYGYGLSKGVLGDIFTDNKKEEAKDAEIPSLDEFKKWSDSQPGLKTVFLDIKVVPGEEDLLEKLLDNVAKNFKDSPVKIKLMTPYEELYVKIHEYKLKNKDLQKFDVTIDHVGGGLRAKAHRIIQKIKTKVKHRFSSTSIGPGFMQSWESYNEELSLVNKFKKNPKDESNTLQIDDKTELISWTINPQWSQYELLQNYRLDGIMTDKPGQLKRLYERYWKDHSTVAKNLAECFKKPPGTICGNGSSLAPYGDIDYEDVREWVCKENGVNTELKDLFGCGGIFDKKNIYFEEKISPKKETVFYKALSGEVKVASVIGDPDGEKIELNFKSKKCETCTLSVTPEYFLDGKWVKGNGATGEDSFVQIMGYPKNAQKLRLILSSSEAGKSSENSVVEMDVKDLTARSFPVMNKNFEGEVSFKKMTDETLTNKNKRGVVVEFEEATCQDGVMNYSCEYKLNLDFTSSSGKKMDSYVTSEKLSGSFQLFYHIPFEAEKLKISMSEMDEEFYSETNDAFLNVIHGDSAEIGNCDGVFSGKLKVKFIDYNENETHSEGLKFTPHLSKPKSPPMKPKEESPSQVLP